MWQTRWHKGNQRFYQAQLVKDMLGDWCILCTWGSLNSRLGNHKTHVFSDKNEALVFVDALNEKRLKRGYTPTAIN